DSDLNALEEQIEISNQNLAVAEAQFRQARATIKFARADLFPTVTVGATANTSQTSPNRSFGHQPFSRQLGTVVLYQIPIDLSYEFDVWGRIRHSVEGNVEATQASAADVETVRLSIQAELAVNYFQLRGLDDARRLFDATLQAYADALQIT